MTGVEIVQAVVQILVSGIKEMSVGLGEGISELAKALFFTTTGTGAEATQSLSIFGVLICVFAGISLCIGLSKLIFHWLSSLGARN